MRTLARFLILLALALGLVPGASAASRPEQASVVHVLTLAGPITPVAAGYVRRGIAEAEAARAAAVVLRLDTPGGLDSAMREIVKDEIASRVPVVVWVAPAGARAASAGMFVAIAAHVAAMAPDTAIGAAHPVGGGGEEIKGPMADKVTNDAAAYARGLAAQRGRNAAWVERAVRKSVSVTAGEAAKLKVVDLVAPSLEALLAAIDGRAVVVAGNRTVLRTKGAATRELPMSGVEGLLFKLADPAIALILLNIGILALVLELQNPGAILPGVVGVICLLLAFFALGMLPVNGAGLALILFGFLLFAAELFVPSFGVLTIGGVIALVLGALMLFGGEAQAIAPAWPFIVTVALGTGAAVGTGMFFALRAQRRRPAMGPEALVGQRAVVVTPLAPRGTVRLEGEVWNALDARPDAAGQLASGTEVVVERVDGLTLYVRPMTMENLGT